MVSSHRQKGRVKRSVLNNIADCLLIEHGDILDVLDNWPPERLLAHLRSRTAKELKPKQLRHQ